MELFLGILIGIFGGFATGYWAAFRAFNHATQRVAKDILEKEKNAVH